MKRETPRRLGLYRSVGGILLRLIFALALVFLAAFDAVHADSNASDKTANGAKPQEMQIGYWIWDMDREPYSSTGIIEPDVLYVMSGTLGKAPRGSGQTLRLGWPDNPPKASTYFALLRVDENTMPSRDIIPKLVSQYKSLKLTAFEDGRKIAGFQLDFDCPTARLGEYALFMKELREALPPGDLISITALLDWFRAGTQIADLLQWVDEYVPQFYDTNAVVTGDEGMARIAVPVEPSRWAPLFNSFGRSYRLGLSAFGRITSIDGEDGASSTQRKRRYFYPQTPLAAMKEMDMKLVSKVRNKSGEMVLLFNAHDMSSNKDPEQVEMIIPTAESVLAAYNAAKAFGGYCAGPVFFRWPSASDSMLLTPDEVRSIIADGKQAPRKSRIEADDGFCSTVNCSDLYVILSDRFPEKSIKLQIRSSLDLEYFIPCENVAAKRDGRGTIEISVPAYAGVPRIYVGRAVTRQPSTFVLEEKP